MLIPDLKIQESVEHWRPAYLLVNTCYILLQILLYIICSANMCLKQ